jgi:dTDP-4-dehydrorhamnose reductase
MRILITGAEGRLGSRLNAELQQRGHDVAGVDVTQLDITNFAAVRAAVRQFQPELAINAAAWTDVDGCAKDPQRAIAINGLGAQNVAAAAHDVGAVVLHISSNEVFDGRSQRAYYEYDVTNPVNPYGYSKWVGERGVMSVNPRHLIVRTAWLFAHGGKNFVHSILNAAAAGKTLRVVTDEVANPTYNEDLSTSIAELIETQRYGIYHLTNTGTCSRYTFARHILDRAGYADVPITAISRHEWSRASTPPVYTGLENLAAAALGIRLRDWQSAVDAFLEREDLPQKS